MGMKITLDVEHYRDTVHEVRRRLRVVPEIEDEMVMELIIEEVLGSAMRVSVDSPQAMENIEANIEELMLAEDVCIHDIVSVVIREQRAQDYARSGVEGRAGEWLDNVRGREATVLVVECVACGARLDDWLRDEIGIDRSS